MVGKEGERGKLGEGGEVGGEGALERKWGQASFWRTMLRARSNAAMAPLAWAS